MQTKNIPTRILHTMLRVKNLQKSLNFYVNILGMTLQRKTDYPDGRFTLAFIGYELETTATVLELTYNWDADDYDKGTAYGHIALAVVDIYGLCDALKTQGIAIIRPPAPMAFDKNEIIAFITDPDDYHIELIEKQTVVDL